MTDSLNFRTDEDLPDCYSLRAMVQEPRLTRPVVGALAAITLAVTSLISIAIMRSNQGFFGYSLDDAYIHLSMSENIRHGVYGVNSTSSASASSSAAWPFILAPFADFSWHQYVPLVLCAIALFFTLCFSYLAIARAWTASGLQAVALVATVTVLGLSLNWFGLVFTGMEHSLQAMLAVLCALGLLELARRGTVPWWFWAAVVAGPLIRYEFAAVSLAALTAAAIMGRWRGAIVSALLAVVLVGCFSVFLILQGLPPLPSSVVVKWAGDGETSSSGILRLLAGNALGKVESNPMVLLLAVLSGAAAVLAWRWSRLGGHSRNLALLLGSASFALSLHRIFGHDGWFGRYEVYVLSYALVLMLAVAAPAVEWAVRNAGASLTVFLMGVVLLVVGKDLVITTIQTPAAARGIYEQQYQLHRFLVEDLKAPSAVDDLGWLSYRNPNDVIDLTGLGSYDAVKARKSGDPLWRSQVVDPSVVPAYVGFLDEASPELPNSWVKVGSLVTPSWPTMLSGTVNVYATDRTSVSKVKAALSSFGDSVGGRTQVVLED